MLIITRKPLLEFSQRYPEAARPLEQWYQIVRAAEWKSLQEVRQVYSQADAATVASGRMVTVFNIGGNKFRLVAAMHYNRQIAYVLRVLTHAEYSKDAWKKRL